MFPESTVRTNHVYSDWHVTEKDKIYKATVHFVLQDVVTYEMFEEDDVEIWFEEDTGITFEPRVLDSDDKILMENEDIVVALIDDFKYNEYVHVFRIYGYNKSDKELNISFENYHQTGEIMNDGSWSIMYLHPGEQSFDNQYLNHAHDATKFNTDFDLVISERPDSGESSELYRKNIHLDFSR